MNLVYFNRGSDSCYDVIDLTEERIRWEVAAAEGERDGERKVLLELSRGPSLEDVHNKFGLL